MARQVPSDKKKVNSSQDYELAHANLRISGMLTLQLFYTPTQ
jgi:hypothetical protein